MTNQPSPNSGEQVSEKIAQPLFNLPPIIIAIIVVLIAIHVTILLGGEQFQIWSQAVLAFNPARFGQSLTAILKTPVAPSSTASGPSPVQTPHWRW